VRGGASGCRRHQDLRVPGAQGAVLPARHVRVLRPAGGACIGIIPVLLLLLSCVLDVCIHVVPRQGLHGLQQRICTRGWSCAVPYMHPPKPAVIVVGHAGSLYRPMPAQLPLCQPRAQRGTSSHSCCLACCTKGLEGDGVITNRTWTVSSHPDETAARYPAFVSSQFLLRG
jgi:hypothetical protein